MACSEEEDNSPPVVQINTPKEMEVFNVGDLINIEAEVSDDIELKRVSSFLRLNRNIVSLGSQKSLSVNQANVRLSLALDDTLLNTSTYTLQVEASDGEKTSSAFVNVNVIGIDERELSYLIATEDGQKSKLYEFDGSNFRLLSSINFQIDKMEVDHRRQFLWITSASDASLHLFDIKANQFIDMKQYQGVSGRYFTDLYYADPFVYAGTKNGEIYRYSNSTNGSIIYNSNENGAIESILAVNDKLVFFENFQGNVPSKITSVLSSGGLAIFRTDFTGELLSIGKSNQGEVGFTAKGALKTFTFYDLDLNTGIRTIQFNTSQPLSRAYSYDQNNHILVDSNMIYSYVYPQNNITNLMVGLTSIEAIEISQLKETFAVTSANELKLIHIGTGNIEASIMLPEPIIGLAVRNNK